MELRTNCRLLTKANWLYSLSKFIQRMFKFGQIEFKKKNKEIATLNYYQMKTRFFPIVLATFLLTLTSFQIANAQYLNPVQPTNPVKGIEYYYFEQTITNEPAGLDTLQSFIKSGPIANFSLQPKLRNDNFTFNYRGYIKVPVDTVYTFYTSSDDGSNLYIDTFKVVSNDGAHGIQEKSGTIRLKAGFHKIRVYFNEVGGNENLNVLYAFASIPKADIPDSVLYRNGFPFPSITGLINSTMFEEDSIVFPFKLKLIGGNLSTVILKSHSSNQTSIPNSEIVFTGVDSNRTIKIKTMANITGSVIIYVNARITGGLVSSSVFTINVLTKAPSISQISDTFFLTNSAVNNIPIKVSDPDNGLNNLILSATSSNQALVLNSAFIFTGIGANRLLSFSSVANAVGNSTITYEVKDSTNRKQQKTFVVTFGDTSTFRSPDPVISPVNGLDYLLARADGGSVLNFTNILPDKVGKILNFNLDPADPNQDFYGMEFRGFIKIKTAGVYTFFTNSDDGSVLYIGNTKVVDNDGSHSTRERSGTANLRAGFHKLTVQYKEGNGGQTLEVRYAGNGISKRLIPDSDLFRNDFRYPVIIASADTVSAYRSFEKQVSFQIEDADGQVSLATAKGFSFNETVIPQTTIQVSSLGDFSLFRVTPILPGFARIKVVATDAQGLSAVQFFNIKVKDTVTSAQLLRSQGRKLILYPNPVYEKFEISGVNPSELITLYDTKGKKKYMGKISDANVAKLPNGFYLIKLENSVQVLKFMKD